MDRGTYLARWSALHGGVDPTQSVLISRWLGLVYTLARPLAAMRVPPDLVTLLGLLVAVGAVWLASLGGAWPVAAAVVVAASGVLDSLDGAVAVLTDRSTRWGAVLDALADRWADSAYLVAFWLLGAPGLACVVAAALMWSHEYVRARATVEGLGDVGVLTIWERPSRVITTAMFLLGCGIYAESADAWASVAAAAWVVGGAVGLGQLVLAVRRRLT